MLGPSVSVRGQRGPDRPGVPGVEDKSPGAGGVFGRCVDVGGYVILLDRALQTQHAWSCYSRQPFLDGDWPSGLLAQNRKQNCLQLLPSLPFSLFNAQELKGIYSRKEDERQGSVWQDFFINVK